MAATNPEVEARARGQGDVVRGALAPLAGALVGGLAVVQLQRGSTVLALLAFAREAFTGTGQAQGAIDQAISLLVRAVLPIGVGAMLGALAVGWAQTRAYLGAPASQVRIAERASPPSWLALPAGLVLLVCALAGLRALTALGVAGDPPALGAGALELGARVVRALLVAIVGVALVDHMLRAQARSARLALSAPPRGSSPPPEPAQDLDALIVNAAMVVHEDDAAFVLGSRDGRMIVRARARGLSALALLEAARRRRVPIRAARGRQLGSLELGAALDEPLLREVGLGPRGPARPVA